VFHRRLEFINWPTCWPWEQHFQYTVVFMLYRGHQFDKRCSRKKQLATVSTDTNSLPKMHSSSDRKGHNAMMKKACNIKDWNLNRRLLNISLFEIKLEDIEDILDIIKLKNKYNYKCQLSISIPSNTLWYNLWFKSYEYELMKPKIIYCICFVCLCDG